MSGRIKNTVTDEITNAIRFAVQAEIEVQTKALRQHSNAMKKTLKQQESNFERFFAFDTIQRVLFWASPISVLILVGLSLLRFFGFL